MWREDVDTHFDWTKDVKRCGKDVDTHFDWRMSKDVEKMWTPTLIGGCGHPL